MSAKLTALIPCKNERKNIRLCIESLREIADEVLVADSGSTDGTLDIVAQMGGCRVIEREYVTDASFKNWAIPQAAHEWVLLVDADERITPALADEIRQILAAPDEQIDGYWIGRHNHYLGHPIRRCGWQNDKVMRLFRRDVCRYHQRWVHSEIPVPRQRAGRLTERMLHYTTWNSSVYLAKLDSYAELGALNMRDEGKPVTRIGMLLAAPARFVQLYFLRMGFLDGMAGFQVCMHAAFYAFMKKAKRWEMDHAIAQPDPEAEINQEARAA